MSNAYRTVGRLLENVGLPVCEQDDAVAVKMLAQHVAEAVRRPGNRCRPALRTQLLDQLADVRQDREEAP